MSEYIDILKRILTLDYRKIQYYYVKNKKYRQVCRDNKILICKNILDKKGYNTEGTLSKDLPEIIKEFSKYNFEINNDYTVKENVFETSNLCLIKFLLKNGKFENNILKASSKMGNIDIIKYILQSYNIKDVSSKVLYNAVKNKNINIVEYLFRKEITIDDKSVIASVLNNDLEMLKLFMKYEIDLNDVKDILSIAVTSGFFKIVKFLIENGIDVNSDINILFKSLRNKQIDIAMYLISKGACGRINEVLHEAISLGEIKLVNQLLDSDAELSSDMLITASKNGFYNGVKLLVEKGIMDKAEEAIKESIKSGHLKILHYLVKRNVSLSSINLIDISKSPKELYINPLVLASKRGYYEVVLFVLQNQVVNEFVLNKALISAAEYGHLNIVKYLVNSQGINPGIENGEALKRSIKNSKKNVIEYLQDEKKVQMIYQPKFTWNLFGGV